MIRTRGLAFAHPGAQAALHFPDMDVPQGGRLPGEALWLALLASLLGLLDGHLLAQP